MNSSTVNGTFFFDPDDKIYQDHFPGNPIVPGSLIIHAFMKACNIEDYVNFQIHSFGFKKFVSPGEYEYKVEKKENKYFCNLLKQNEIYATGIFMK